MSCFHGVGDENRFKVRGVSPYRAEELKRIKDQQAKKRLARAANRNKLFKVSYKLSFWKQF